MACTSSLILAISSFKVSTSEAKSISFSSLASTSSVSALGLTSSILPSSFTTTTLPSSSVCSPTGAGTFSTSSPSCLTNTEMSSPSISTSVPSSSFAISSFTSLASLLASLDNIILAILLDNLSKRLSFVSLILITICGLRPGYSYIYFITYSLPY